LVYVANDLGKKSLWVYQNRLVAATEQRAIIAVTPVEALRIYTVDVAHDARKIGIGSLEENMVVVGHEAIRCHPNPPELANVVDKGKEAGVIGILTEYRLTPQTTIHDVIPGSREQDSEWS
jgi:hypothetical protein